jgi:beta-phosphoglucomutase-like phosphatase (HAD superfamily)
VYLYALAQLGIGPDEAIAFEDSVLGLAAAKAAGIFTVVTPCSWTVSHDLSAADVRFTHLGDDSHPLAHEDAVRAGATKVTLEALLAMKHS